MEEKLKDLKIDTLTTTETISGLTFNCFVINIHIAADGTNDMVMRMYGTLYHGNSFGVNIAYLDHPDALGKQMLSSFRSSTFDPPAERTKIGTGKTYNR